MIPTREQAIELLQKYNTNEALIKHALNVEGVMRHFAEKNGEDVEYWGMIGLLHDIDYEQFPELHNVKAIEILREHGIDENVIRSIISHGYGLCAGVDVEPVHTMEKTLYAIDELTGLVNAAALMRPSKSTMDLEYKSLWKKYKQASFAAGVNRSVIERGCEMMGADLKEIIEETITAMRKVETNA